MTSPEFVHLHNHTEYSTLDGLQRLSTMCQVAADDNQRAIAITDHYTLAGAPGMVQAAAAAGIKPILGQEMGLAIGSRKEQNVDTGTDDGVDAEGADDTEKTRRYFHLTVLAQNQTGWRNLIRLNNDAALHVYSKPRTDIEILTEHGDGLILGTGCLGGPVASQFLKGTDAGVKAAYANAEQLLSVVGGDKDRLFVEVMSHGIAAEDAITPQLIELARHFGLRVVATNDAHYTFGCDHDEPDIRAHYGHGCEPEAHDLLLALGTNTMRDAPKRYQFAGHGYHLRTAAEMHAQFAGVAGAQDACSNSLVVAEMIEDQVMPDVRYHLPTFQVPAADLTEYEARAKEPNCPFTSASHFYLWKQMRAGAVERYGTRLPDKVRKNLARELKVINDAGMCDYMLITQDVQQRARAKGVITGPGRGSAVGSSTSYVLGITDIEPVTHDLLFERFLDPKRAGMPDIDSDFDRASRYLILHDLQQVYGDDRVALIGTRGTYKAKAALRNVGRLTDRAVLGGDLADAVWSKAGKTATLDQLADASVVESTTFQQTAAANPDAATLIDLASTIEGTRSNLGIHACGVLVCDEPMHDQVPLRRDKASGMWVTEWEGPELDALGYLKMDILGLRTLDVISTCLQMMRESGHDVPAITYRDIEIDPSSSTLAAKAWTLIGQGRTDGVFQLASEGMKRLAQQIQPRTLDDLSALVALYRPGPMGAGMHDMYGDRKHGRAEVSYDYLTTDPGEQAAIGEVLDATYGLCCFQEQVMSLAGVVAGFGPSAKNKLRKAFSKKKKEEMDALRDSFLEGAGKVTVDGEDSTASIRFSQSTAREIWRTFDASADYVFNRSHSVAYGFTAYVTALLKANWPSHFGAATLAVTDDDSKRAAILESLKNDGIAVRPPSVQTGRLATWVAPDGGVVLGLGEVEGVGENAAAIVAEREKNGAFSSLADLVNRVKVVSSTPADAKTWTNSTSSAICHRCLSVIDDSDGNEQEGVSESDVANFGLCTCRDRLHRPVEDEEPATRSWTDEHGRAITIKAVKAGRSMRLRRTVCEPVLDDGGQPVMKESNLSLGIVENLIRAGACDEFGPRLGMLAVVRALRTVPDLPIPDLRAGIIEQERTAGAKLGVTVGSGPLGDARMRQAALNWAGTVDWGREARNQIVGVHRMNEQKTYLCVGVLDRWHERRTRAGKRMVNFTVSDTKASMEGVAWEFALDELDRAGMHPAKGDIVALDCQVKSRTYTRTVQMEDASLDTDTGEEVDALTETVTVREMVAERISVFPGDVGGQEVVSPPAIRRPHVVGVDDAPAGHEASESEESTQDKEPEPEPELGASAGSSSVRLEFQKGRVTTWEIAAAFEQAGMTAPEGPAMDSLHSDLKKHVKTWTEVGTCTYRLTTPLPGVDEVMLTRNPVKRVSGTDSD